MAERKAVNKYYPVDWTPAHGSVNKYHKSHPLGNRARKLKTKGTLVVRFEMPWNAFCSKCKDHIAKGKRYNADKKYVGDYFTTRIYEFSFICLVCRNPIAIKTDPENRDYAVVRGLDRKSDIWNDPTIGLVEDEEPKGDPFQKIEKLNEDVAISNRNKPALMQVLDINEEQVKNDYEINGKLRAAFREKKKKTLSSFKASEARGFGIRLLEENEEDRKLAEAFKFKTKKITPQQDAKNRRQKIRSSSIFGNETKKSTVKNNLRQKGVDIKELRKKVERASGGITPVSFKTNFTQKRR
eukprot:TRINITY_DN2577_c0_g1_i2.p1 TRINITY_DN2577_c0_g1~~TRINITY_DN2577_c0_g1_i2.p1  ORF type:complete len:306 (-),score=74.54 TRINITY_DN2577_c0_g1_i2:1822-2712(-)